MSARFNIKAADPAAVSRLRRDLGLPRFMAATLAARGVVDADAARALLSPSLERDWLDPYLIPGLAEVADAVEAAVRAGKRIVVFGDFDLDGVSATAVLTRGLTALGADAIPFIPLRFEEGYGLTRAAFERACALGPDLIVTVDCGISAKEEAEFVVEAGVGLAITDHHEPADLVPEGVPVADPKLDPSCESAVLAGVGVALKLVQVLGGRFGQPHLWREYTDLATLGTVADLMPMRGENRALVADGLARINAAPRPCVGALLACAGVADKALTATNMSFSIIPRLNAAGRMGDACAALDLLLSDDFEDACAKAAELERINDERRAIEAELSEIAKVQAEEVYHGQRALVVSGEGWHEGVKGIVASRLVGVYGVPALLFTIDGEEARGSGRSVGQVNLFKAVESASDLLTRFGGHEAAVGVTLPAANLPAFEERLIAYLDELPATSFHPLIDIDACVDLSELTLENVEMLEQLAPFGQENPVPRFLARDVVLESCRAVGQDKNHFSCQLSDGKSQIAGIMFHCAEIESLMRCGSVVNAAFEVQIDEWRGRRSVKAMLSSLSPAKPCAALEACLDPESVGFVADLYAASDAEICADSCESAEDVEAWEAARERNREEWEERALADPAALEEEVVRALIGDAPLRASQRAVLASLAEGTSTLAVMATGRGKSLTFQVHAAVCALARGQASLFVYPLRALIADQAFHMTDAFERFGISVSVLTGESAPEERAQVFSGLASGESDIVLTTPEFLSCHAREFAQAGRIGFVVVDEAHHVALARAGQRPAYASLGQSIAQLGNPVVLALTATVGTEEARTVADALRIERCVLDETRRPNLAIDDQRSLRNRESYLANLIASGEKTIVYVGSREQSVRLARSLRVLVPQMASLIGFYNAGLARAERARVEQLLRTDALAVLVATSAFGEGIDIPNVRHVVLFSLPFNAIEFNQMSGRAGRDGEPATVHLLFSRADAMANEGILRNMTPDHDCMAQVYRELRRMQREADGEFFAASDADLAQRASVNQHHPISAESAACGVAVFRELGLIETRTTYTAGEARRAIRVREGAERVELTDSVRYREGLGEQEVFQSFRDWVIKSTREELEECVTGAILPDRASLEVSPQDGADVCG